MKSRRLVAASSNWPVVVRWSAIPVIHGEPIVAKLMCRGSIGKLVAQRPAGCTGIPSDNSL
jgi:hypothetical protein